MIQARLPYTSVLLLAFLLGAGAAADAEVDALAAVKGLAQRKVDAGWRQEIDRLVNTYGPEQSLRVIGYIKSERLTEAWPALVNALDSFDPAVVAAAVDALPKSLGEHPPAVAGIALRPRLESTNAATRSLAAVVAGQTRDEYAIPFLVKMLETKDLPPEPIALSLKQITGIDLGTEAHAWSSWFALANLNYSKSFAAVAAGLTSSDPRAVIDAINSLRSFSAHQDESARLIEPLTGSANQLIAQQAAAAMGRLGGHLPLRIPPEQLREFELQLPANTYSMLSEAEGAMVSRLGEASEVPPQAKSQMVVTIPPVEQRSADAPSAWWALLLLLPIAGAWWWMRRLIAATRMPSVGEVVARAQRDSGIDSERDLPAVRKSAARPMPVVSGVKPPALAAPAGKSALKPAVDATVGKRGEKIFNLD